MMSGVIALDDALRERLVTNLAGFAVRREELADLTHAAVAITVVARRGEACFLLTRRTATLRNHSGQYALPGGRVDPGETAEQAALRELHEELGLDLGPDRVLGRLDDYPTRSGYAMAPVVVWGADAGPVRPSPHEVARVHYVPLAQLQQPPIIVEEPGNPDRVMRLRLQGRFIHAPTAAVLHQFAEVGLAGRTTRVRHFGQPRFTWR